jgi:hypothetical protein
LLSLFLNIRFTGKSICWLPATSASVNFQLECTEFPKSGFVNSSLSVDRFYVNSVGNFWWNHRSTAKKERHNHDDRVGLLAPSFRSNDCQHHHAQAPWHHTKSNNNRGQGKWEKTKERWLLFPSNQPLLHKNVVFFLRRWNNGCAFCTKTHGASSNY